MNTVPVQLEHANLNVGRIPRALEFLAAAFPEFRIRGGAKNADGTGWKWVHVGTETTYLALSEASGLPREATDRGPQVNHLGFVVADVAAIRKRLLAAGFHEGYVPEPHPWRKRLYFLDGDGLEWEFVEYLSDDPAKRNDYVL